MAGLIAVLIAIPLGTISALYRDTWIDHTVRVVAVSGLAIPSFWLGMLIILALLSLFNWLPKIGYVPFWQDPIANLSVTIWPAASVGYRYAAVATRMMRSSLLEVMREDYIRTARAKGVWTRLIMRRHALRNALLPVVTVIGLEFAFLIGGLVVTEQVFNINGIGKLFVDATARGDFNLIQGLVLLIATIFIFVNLLVDLLYGWLDPRIRLTLRAAAMATVATTPSVQVDTHAQAAERALAVRQEPAAGPGRLPDHPALRGVRARRRAGSRPSIPRPSISPPCCRRPGAEHWFGTDQYGRDVFSRIVYGSRTALAVGILSAAVRLHAGRAGRRGVGLFRRPHRQRHPARGRHHAVVSHHRAGHGGGGGARQADGVRRRL